jgi:hypothetical protein
MRICVPINTGTLPESLAGGRKGHEEIYATGAKTYLPDPIVIR